MGWIIFLVTTILFSLYVYIRRRFVNFNIFLPIISYILKGIVVIVVVSSAYTIARRISEATGQDPDHASVIALLCSLIVIVISSGIEYQRSNVKHPSYVLIGVVVIFWFGLLPLIATTPLVGAQQSTQVVVPPPTQTTPGPRITCDTAHLAPQAIDELAVRATCSLAENFATLLIAGVSAVGLGVRFILRQLWSGRR